MGEKSGLSDSFSETLSAVGMTHVVVASGAHLGILIGFAKNYLVKFPNLLAFSFRSSLCRHVCF